MTAHSLCRNRPQRLFPRLVTALCTVYPVTNSSCLRKEPARRKEPWRTLSLCPWVTDQSCWRSTLNFLRLWLMCHCHSLLDSKNTLLSLLLVRFCMWLLLGFCVSCHGMATVLCCKFLSHHPINAIFQPLPWSLLWLFLQVTKGHPQSRSAKPAGPTLHWPPRGSEHCSRLLPGFWFWYLPLKTYFKPFFDFEKAFKEHKLLNKILNKENLIMFYKY